MKKYEKFYVLEFIIRMDQSMVGAESFFRHRDSTKWASEFSIISTKYKQIWLHVPTISENRKYSIEMKRKSKLDQELVHKNSKSRSTQNFTGW